MYCSIHCYCYYLLCIISPSSCIIFVTNEIISEEDEKNFAMHKTHKITANEVNFIFSFCIFLIDAQLNTNDIWIAKKKKSKKSHMRRTLNAPKINLIEQNSYTYVYKYRLYVRRCFEAQHTLTYRCEYCVYAIDETMFKLKSQISDDNRVRALGNTLNSNLFRRGINITAIVNKR